MQSCVELVGKVLAWFFTIWNFTFLLLTSLFKDNTICETLSTIPLSRAFSAQLNIYINPPVLVRIFCLSIFGRTPYFSSVFF